MERSMIPSACPGCGAVVPGGELGCQALYDELRSRTAANATFASFARMVHDTYCVQHPDRYVGRDRPKGLAAHLGGLCWAIEYGGHPTGYRALQRWLERVPWQTVPMPELPVFRGGVTVVEIHRALTEPADPWLVRRVVERWARSAWDAYAPLHHLARGWIDAALATPHARRR